MSETSRERVVEAVNILITSDNYARMINEMTGILESWATHPMTYAGHLSPLNAMLDVGIQDRGAFERLVKLIEAKRKLIPETKRVDYQREYMAERRARLARAVELRTLQRGPFKSVVARKGFEREITGRWMAARDTFIAGKGDLDWAGRNEAANEFWATVDANLEKNLVAERAKARG